jgi:anti-sigma factor RsiW
MKGDPEKERLDELIVKVGRDQASDAEREELELYLEDHPEIEARLAEIGYPVST